VGRNLTIVLMTSQESICFLENIALKTTSLSLRTHW